MSDGDVTWSAIRKNWPILLVIATLIAGGVRTEMNVATNDSRLVAVEKMLDTKELTQFTRWQVTIERDIKELQKICGQK